MPDFRAALGRGSDRMMGHLTPGEAIIPSGAMTPKLYSAFSEALSKQGMMPEQYIVGSGYNSINPMTGQPEFLAQAASPGRSVRDYQRDRVQGPEGGRGGGLSTAQIAAYTNPTTGYGPTRAAAAAKPDVPSDEWVTGPGGEWGTMRDVNLGPVVDLFMPGPIEALMDLVGADPTVEVFEPAVQTAGTGFAPGGERPGAGRPLQGMSGQRLQMEQSFTRPKQMPTPQFLGLSSAMSPLQMRTAIASRAIAGQAGEYTSPEAQAFYDNLLQRALIGDEGDLFGLDALLPIDLQYLAQIRGIQNPADTAGLLNALVQ